MLPTYPGREEQDLEDFLHLARHRTDHNYSPHGAVGDTRPRSVRPSSTSDLDRWLPKLSLDGKNKEGTGEAWPSSKTMMSSSTNTGSITTGDGNMMGAFISTSTTTARPSAIKVPGSSTPWIEDDEDTAFKNDLAHVLVWFEQDLNSQQRLSTVFTLAKNLSKWQLEMLIRCLGTHDDGFSPIPNSMINPMPSASLFSSETTIINNGLEDAFVASPGSSPYAASNNSAISWRSIAIASPEPMKPPGLSIDRWQSFSHRIAATTNAIDTLNLSHSNNSSPPLSLFSSSPPTSNSNNAIPTDENVNVRLFYLDLCGWLRHHRLHKYESSFRVLKSRQCLELTDETLDYMGVKALGARRKFLRLFEIIRRDEQPKT